MLDLTPHLPRPPARLALCLRRPLRPGARGGARRRARRLLAPGPATWGRFRRRLDATDYLELLLGDAAVTQPFRLRCPGPAGDRGGHGVAAAGQPGGRLDGRVGHRGG